MVSSRESLAPLAVEPDFGRNVAPLGPREAGMSTNWGLNYAWGLPVIVLTVIIHAYGLGLINKFFSSTLVGAVPLRNLRVPSTFFVGRAVLLVTILHGLECAIWAGAYRF